jgi:hypothetical protein
LSSASVAEEEEEEEEEEEAAGRGNTQPALLATHI